MAVRVFPRVLFASSSEFDWRVGESSGFSPTLRSDKSRLPLCTPSALFQLIDLCIPSPPKAHFLLRWCSGYKFLIRLTWIQLLASSSAKCRARLAG